VSGYKAKTYFFELFQDLKRFFQFSSKFFPNLFKFLSNVQSFFTYFVDKVSKKKNHIRLKIQILDETLAKNIHEPKLISFVHESNKNFQVRQNHD